MPRVWGCNREGDTGDRRWAVNLIIIVVLGVVAINIMSKALAHKPTSAEARTYGCGGMLASVVVLAVAYWVVLYGGGL
jgi:hypothetical protein